MSVIASDFNTVSPYPGSYTENVFILRRENFADFSTKFGEPTNEPFGADLMQGPSPNPQYAEMQPVLAPTISANRPQVPHQFSIRYAYTSTCTLVDLSLVILITIHIKKGARTCFLLS